MRGVLKRLPYEAVQALARTRRGLRHPPVQLRRHSQRQVTGIGPLRLLAALAAPLFVIRDGVRECLGQFIQRAALKGEHIAGVDDFAVEDARLPGPPRWWRCSPYV